jgi:hypothetical protein
MTESSTWFYSQTGRIKLFMNQKMSHHARFPQKRALRHRQIKHSNPVPGREVSFGVHERHSGILHNWSLTTRTTSFPRNVHPVSPPSPLIRIMLSNMSVIVDTVRPRKRLRTDGGQVKDKFNLSNDHFYEVSKEGGRHRVRQTFGQLVVEHAYPAQKLQLPFVSSWHTYATCQLIDLSLITVQDTLVKARGAVIPQARIAVPVQH